MILLKTDTPEFYGDICEVVRLFLGPVEIRMDGGERLLTHTHETAFRFSALRNTPYCGYNG